MEQINISTNSLLLMQKLLTPAIKISVEHSPRIPYCTKENTPLTMIKVIFQYIEDPLWGCFCMTVVCVQFATALLVRCSREILGPISLNVGFTELSCDKVKDVNAKLSWGGYVCCCKPQEESLYRHNFLIYSTYTS